MVRTPPSKTCDACSEAIPLSSRICPFCQNIAKEFRRHVSLCECGEHSVYSSWGGWNCGKSIQKTLPPVGEWHCIRCGGWPIEMGGMTCASCLDYLALREARQKGVDESEIPFYIALGSSSNIERQPDCQVCARQNDKWRSFCISCGNYLIKRAETADVEVRVGRGSGCMSIFAVLLLSLGIGFAMQTIGIGGA